MCFGLLKIWALWVWGVSRAAYLEEREGHPPEGHREDTKIQIKLQGVSEYGWKSD